jgi:hypothetical protein
MSKYRIIISVVTAESYEVEANSELEAKALVENAETLED